MSNKKSYYAFHKPYGVLSQFKKEVAEHVTLADFINIPIDNYPVGRLDKDSEGLLILTNDNTLKNNLLDPKSKSPKTYWVQLDHKINQKAVEKLQTGITIKHNKKSYNTLPADVKIINQPVVEDRDPPVRFRAEIPTSWIQITIHEGKNRQVRKMCASVGFPVLRLIRVQLKGLNIKGIKIGKLKELSPAEVRLLR